LDEDAEVGIEFALHNAWWLQEHKSFPEVQTEFHCTATGQWSPDIANVTLQRMWDTLRPSGELRFRKRGASRILRTSVLSIHMANYIYIYIYIHTYIHTWDWSWNPNSSHWNVIGRSGTVSRLFYRPAKKKPPAVFLSLHFRSRKEIFGVTFKSVHLMIFYFFNYIGLKLPDFKLRQSESIYMH
jgi:hypothetical protein